MDNNSYSPPLALTVLSAIFLILGAICFLVVTADIVWRKGWRSMMGVMIPVYPINAAYMLPLSLYVYFKYGRAAKPIHKLEAPNDQAAAAKTCHSSEPVAKAGSESSDSPTRVRSESGHQACHSDQRNAPAVGSPQQCDGKDGSSAKDNPDYDVEKVQGPESDADMAHCCRHDTSRPMWATVLVGVSHCGAGCMLGDLVGEWLVYGTNARISGQMIWVELLVDYAFALLFGIAFQYFSIAPMSGEYGPKTVWRAAKADIVSLTSFEVGAFGWMIIYQVGIFNYQLEMTTWTYWWMMQIGMAFGFATAMPINYWLLKKGIKEPCC